MANNDNDQPNDHSRKPPSSLEGILKWSLQQGDSSVEEVVDKEPMDAERREFLSEMLDEVTAKETAVSDTVTGNVSVLKSQSASEDDVAVALENLADWVEDIDMAKSLHGLGGVIPTIALLGSDKAGLRWRAAELIGNLTHNNSSCQDLAMQCRVMQRIVPLLDDNENIMVRLKAVRACSCLVRGHDPLLTTFERSVEAKRGIAYCVMSNDARLQTKAMFALRTIIEDRESIAGKLDEEDLVQPMINSISEALVTTKDTAMWEQSLRFLIRLSEHASCLHRIQERKDELITASRARRDWIATLDCQDRELLSDESQLHRAFLAICSKDGAPHHPGQ